MDFAQRLAQLRLVPVVEIAELSHAVPLAHTLLQAGLPCAEVTLRTDEAVAAIGQIARSCPDIFLGAGTVLTTEQAEAAIEAGAQFIVAPGFNPTVVDRVRELGVPMLPGVCTPSEIELALSHEISLLKFYPAEAMGGVTYLKAVCAPYRNARFVPTGGIAPDNLLTYLEHPQVIACGGSWMVKKDLLAAGDFERIGELVREAVDLASKLTPSAVSQAGGGPR